MVAAGQGLERDQGGVVALQDLDAGGGFDVGLGGAAGDGVPSRGSGR